MDPSYNNSFGTQGGNLGSQGGDIILQPDNSQKSKKGIVIVIAVLLVLLVVAAILYFVSGRQGSGGNANNDNVSVETAFNRYANYLVSGEVKDEEVAIGEFDGNISLDEKYDEKNYVDEIAELYKNFYNAIISSQTDSFAEYDVTRILEDYDFLTSRLELAPVDSATLKNKYTEGGYDAALSYLRESTRNEGEGLISSYNGYRLMYGTAFIDYLSRYDSAGCLKDGEIVPNCITGDLANAADTSMNNVFEAQRMGEDMVNSALDRIKGQAIGITEKNDRE